MKRHPSNLEGKNILVAGGSGLVGTTLTKRLNALGAQVLSTYFSNKPSFLKNVYKYFDFTKFEDCMDSTRSIDYVFICAAQTFGAKVTQENPSLSILPNLKINSGLLEACRLNKVEKIVMMSSSTVYQEASYPIREDQLDLDQSPYNFYYGVGWMNRYIEKLATLYYKEYDIKIGIVRPTSIYGPHDKFCDEKSHVIPALIKKALQREKPYVVWGSPDTVRDFLFVEDLVEDLLNILNEYCVCDPINITSGESINIRSAAQIILDVCGHNILPYRMLSSEKFESIFGKKERTPFREGVSKTVDWYKSIMQSQ